MLTTLALLLGSAAFIYLSCEYFVNGVEWVGKHLGVSQTAVGTVLAAFGTALPESVVTFVAVVFGGTDAQKEIGVGAAIGGPLVLATLAYAVVGLVFLTARSKKNIALLANVNVHKLSRDQAWFIGIFIVKVALGIVAFVIKQWLGILFFLVYAIYIWREMQQEDEVGVEHEELEPLKFRPKDAAPSTVWALTQTFAALIVIFLSSRLFVHQLDAVGPWLGISPQLVALLLSPVATELPEILNAVIWVKKGKVALALGNISGAMMIQATIPSGLALLFTPWILSAPLLWGAGITLVSVTGLNWCLRCNAVTPVRLALFAVFYGVFATGLFILRA